jgi:Domain of unknown function (DUF1707)
MSDDHASRPTPILASDAERERSIAVLRDAVSEGRLTCRSSASASTLPRPRALTRSWRIWLATCPPTLPRQPPRPPSPKSTGLSARL